MRNPMPAKEPDAVGSMRLLGGFRSTTLLLVGLVATPYALQARLGHRDDRGVITITGFDCSDRSVAIPETIGGLPVTQIQAGAFTGCTTLTSVILPGSLSRIGDGAFSYCTSLTRITIPAGVVSIGSEAFSGCTNLTSIDVDPSNLIYSSLGGVVFDKSLTSPIQFPGGKTGNYAIPNGVTSLQPSVFQGCTGLTGVSIPRSLKRIGGGAFFGCINLTNVTMEDGVEWIGDSAFGDCTGLTQLTIPHTVTNIGWSAFLGCERLSAVYFTGDVPELAGPLFDGTEPTFVHSLPGTIGWDARFGGRPTAPWVLPHPLILTYDSRFGPQPGGFTFVISWATNLPVLVEATTNPTAPAWTPVSTNGLTSGAAEFRDPEWTNQSARYYRLRGL